MYKKILITFFIFSNILASAQDIYKYIDSNIVKIRTINSNDTNYADLEPIGEAIGNARIVMMGEQDHGDAPTFLAKARLIKYLHEKKGFDVIAFESNFYNMERPIVQTNYQKFSSIYSIWTQCLECKPTFDYILTEDFSKNPITLSGIDCRHKGTNYKLYIKELITSQNIDTAKESNKRFLSIAFEVLENEYKSNCTKENKSFFINQLDSLISNFNSDTKNGSFWLQELMNLKSYSRSAWLLKDKNENPYNIRDRQMANNLLWLAQNKYPNKKIIVWAHSFHIAKNFQLYGKYAKQSTTMGTLAYSILKNETYILGFTSLEGTTGRVNSDKKFTIKKPTKKCPELIFASKNINYGFVNFKTIPIDTYPKKYKMKMLGHNLQNGNWHEMFDGVFFIKDMYPCENKKF